MKKIVLILVILILREIGLFDNKDGHPDLMAIAKLQSPIRRDNAQQFVIKVDF